jgi:hypothetical protein
MNDWLLFLDATCEFVFCMLVFCRLEATLKLRYGSDVLSPVPEWEAIRESHRSRVVVYCSLIIANTIILFYRANCVYSSSLFRNADRYYTLFNRGDTPFPA